MRDAVAGSAACIEHTARCKLEKFQPLHQPVGNLPLQHRMRIVICRGMLKGPADFAFKSNSSAMGAALRFPPLRRDATETARARLRLFREAVRHGHRCASQARRNRGQRVARTMHQGQLQGRASKRSRKSVSCKIANPASSTPSAAAAGQAEADAGAEARHASVRPWACKARKRLRFRVVLCQACAKPANTSGRRRVRPARRATNQGVAPIKTRPRNFSGQRSATIATSPPSDQPTSSAWSGN